MPTTCEPWPGKTQAWPGAFGWGSGVGGRGSGLGVRFVSPVPGPWPAGVVTLGLPAPLHYGGGAGEAGAEGYEEQVVAGAHAAFIDGLAESDGDGGGGC